MAKKNSGGDGARPATIADLAAELGTGTIKLRGKEFPAVMVSAAESGRVRKLFPEAKPAGTFHLGEDGSPTMVLDVSDPDYRARAAERSGQVCAGEFAIATRLPVAVENGQVLSYAPEMGDSEFKSWLMKAHRVVLDRFSTAEIMDVLKQLGTLGGTVGDALGNSSTTQAPPKA